MSRCLNLTCSGEYAIAALCRLALMESEPLLKPISTQVLAREQGIPKSFLNKIMAQGAKAGIIRSKKGPSGGVALAKSPERIFILDIIEIYEGKYGREFCLFYKNLPCSGPNCRVYCPLRKEEEELRERLGRVSLAQMAGSLKIHPNKPRGVNL